MADLLPDKSSKSDIISKAEDYTHSTEFESDIQNIDVRKLLRITMDLAEGLTNMYSNQFDSGLIPPDKQSLREDLERLEDMVDRIEEKRR